MKIIRKTSQILLLLITTLVFVFFITLWI